MLKRSMLALTCAALLGGCAAVGHGPRVVADGALGTVDDPGEREGGPVIERSGTGDVRQDALLVQSVGEEAHVYGPGHVVHGDRGVDLPWVRHTAR